MFSALNSGSSSLSSSPGQAHCVVFLGKTVYSQSASLQPGIQMGTSELKAGVTLWWTSQSLIYTLGWQLYPISTVGHGWSTVGCPSTKCLEQTLSSSLGCQFFPCFRVFSIDGFNPLLSIFRVSFQCWKRISWKRSEHVQSWLTRWQLCEMQNTPSISAADMYCYCSQPQHKSSLPYLKIIMSAIFFLKTRRSPKNLLEATQHNLKQALFIPTCSQSHAILWSTAGTPNSLIQLA